MSSGTLSLLDYGVIGVLLGTSVAIGIYHAVAHRRKSGTSEFLMAGRSMGVLPVSLSLLATYFSAVSLLGIPAEIYTYGIHQWLFVLSYLVVIPATAYFYLPVFYEARLTSAYEYLELRFNSSIRKIASSIFIVQTVLYTTVAMYGPALALSQVTGLDIWGSVGIIGVICIVYTSLGGMRAVLWTDTFQMIIMFISFFTIVIKGCLDIGGILPVWKRAVHGNRVHMFDFRIDPTLRHSFWSISVGGIFTWLCSYGVSQSLVQRYLTTKTMEKAQKSLWWNLLGLAIMTTMYCFGGLVIYAKYWDCDPLQDKRINARDQLLPLFVMDTLAFLPGFPGLFVAGVFSAALSTMSSGLNGLAAVTLEDFIRPLVSNKLSEERATILTKLIPVIYGAASMAIVAVIDRFGNLVQMSLSINGMVGGPLLGVFSLGIFFPWANNVGAYFGLASGLTISLWMGIGAQLYRKKYPPLPVSTEHCPSSALPTFAWNDTLFQPSVVLENGTTGLPSAVTSFLHLDTNFSASDTGSTFTVSSVAMQSDNSFGMEEISFLWYSTISALTVFLIGAAVSYATKHYTKPVNPALLSPPIRRLIEKLPHSPSSLSLEKPRVSGFNVPPENEMLLIQELMKINVKQHKYDIENRI